MWFRNRAVLLQTDSQQVRRTDLCRQCSWRRFHIYNSDMKTEKKDIRLLIVEDEVTLAGIISDTLSENGFEVRVAHDGIEALKAMETFSPEIIVTDIMMPRMDGYTFVSRIREDGFCMPVLFLSARSGTDDVVKGFETGAGDYIRKPFAMKELIVRIRSLLDRHETAVRKQNTDLSGQNPIEIGCYRFDPLHRKLWIHGTPQSEASTIPSMESELLALLCGRAGEVVHNSFILKKLWGNDDYFTTRSLNVHITRLRKRLASDPSVSIDSFRGIGYRISF